MKKLFKNWRDYTLLEASFARFKSKIDDEGMPFMLISAYREGGNNQTNHKALKSDLASMGYSFTEVVGGGQEELKDPESGEFLTDDEGKPMVTAVREMTLLVTPEGRGTGDMEMTRETILKLFDAGKQLSGKYEQFAFIFGYPQEVMDALSEEPSSRMFIGAYTSDAILPGDEHRVKDDWAGPWTTIDEAADDDIYYTKIAGTKGTLVQEAIKAKILEVKREMTTHHQFDRMKKNYTVKRLKSLLK